MTEANTSSVARSSAHMSNGKGPSVAHGGEKLIAAAQYLRMSTENQRYSIVNQAQAIKEYAESHGYKVLVSYADPGKSGLTLKHRPGLQQLLTDAIDPQRAFKAVLVLDVSRWGRFQDPDEAAHYEFLCRQAGLKIVYCAEPFESDGSPMSTLVKDLKRVMASEYSRELSAKMSRAKLRLSKLGFLNNPNLPYGFRRLLVDHNGKPRFVMKRGEKKSLKTDRVLIVPGPPEEQDVIRRIFHWYADDGLSVDKVVKKLHATGAPGSNGRRWSRPMVDTILKSELCIGQYVINRTRSLLNGRQMRIPPEEWIRVRVMDPIIPEALFWKAQEALRTRHGQLFSRGKTLAALRRLLKSEGRISVALIAKTKDVPCASTMAAHFGSLDAALAEIGYVRPPTFTERHKKRYVSDQMIFEGLRRLHREHGFVIRKLIDQDPELPTADVIRKRYGSMCRAYELSGLGSFTHKQISNAAQARRQIREAAFLKAGGTRKRIHTSQELLAGLRRILKKHGYLSARLIDEDRGMPSAATVARRFGSHRRAYRLIGWSKSRAQLMRESVSRRYRAASAPRQPAQSERVRTPS